MPKIPHQTPLVERDPQRPPLPTSEVEERNPNRVHARLVSIRKRLLDPDNLSGKSLTDCLRNAGFLCDDSAEEISYQIEQRKPRKDPTSGQEEEEGTLVYLTYPTQKSIERVREKIHQQIPNEKPKI
jgi:hypothetical protein